MVLLVQLHPTEKPNKNAESIEKAVENKDVLKESDKNSKKRKKDKSDDKEEGAIDSEIEEGEITKKHKKSKKKDKKKDRSERDKKDRTERDKSGRDRSDPRDKHKRRHSDSRSESRSESRSHKKHKGSRSKSRSDDDGDSDISIGTTKMVEKSYFSESRGCWVTRMVPKEDDSPSPEVGDGNEPYDIGDTYIRHPAHDRRSVFDRLGGGSSSRGRGRYNDRHDDRNPRYGYSRRRGRSYSRSHSRSRSRSRSPKFHIDKKKLLEIAKANALMRMRAGDLPSNLPITESMKKAADSCKLTSCHILIYDHLYSKLMRQMSCKIFLSTSKTFVQIHQCILVSSNICNLHVPVKNVHHFAKDLMQTFII